METSPPGIPGHILWLKACPISDPASAIWPRPGVERAAAGTGTPKRRALGVRSWHCTWVNVQVMITSKRPVLLGLEGGGFTSFTYPKWLGPELA